MGWTWTRQSGSLRWDDKGGGRGRSVAADVRSSLRKQFLMVEGTRDKQQLLLELSLYNTLHRPSMSRDIHNPKTDLLQQSCPVVLCPLQPACTVHEF
jgi:hypothetical protein